MSNKKKTTENTHLDQERKDAKELLEILEKVPEERKREAVGIVKGFVLGVGSVV